MSQLIDDIVYDFNEESNYNKNSDCYGELPFFERLKDAIRVLMGKSRAYHFKEDEVENKNRI